MSEGETWLASLTSVVGEKVDTLVGFGFGCNRRVGASVVIQEVLLASRRTSR